MRPTKVLSLIYRQIRLLLLFFILAITITEYSSGSETYSINGKKLLLPYKFINWWHDCPSEQFERYCESRIQYKNTGVTKVYYNNDNQTLRLTIDDSFKTLIDIFNQDEKKLNHPILKPTYLNDKYFGSGYNTAFSSNKTMVKYFEFSGVKQTNYQTFKSMESDLGFELEGTLYGLTNEKLTLYSSRYLQRGCRKYPQRIKDEKSYIMLRLFHSLTNETLATYSISNR